MNILNSFFCNFMDSNSVAGRLKDIIAYLGLTDSQFADRCEISRATLSLLLSGKNKKVSDVILSQIHKSFPNVSIVWLLFGEGDMTFDNDLKSENPTESSKTIFEDIVYPDSSQEKKEYSNLTPLNQLENAIKMAVNKSFDSFINNRFFPLKNDSDENNRRKVKQITVYYEDSTFETFLPES